MSGKFDFDHDGKSGSAGDMWILNHVILDDDDDDDFDDDDEYDDDDDEDEREEKRKAKRDRRKVAHFIAKASVIAESVRALKEELDDIGDALSDLRDDVEDEVYKSENSDFYEDLRDGLDEADSWFIEHRYDLDELADYLEIDDD